MFLEGYSGDVCPSMSSIRMAYISSDKFQESKKLYENKLFPRLEKMFNLPQSSLTFEEAEPIVDAILTNWNEKRKTFYSVDSALLDMSRKFLNDAIYMTRFSFERAA